MGWKELFEPSDWNKKMFERNHEAYVERQKGGWKNMNEWYRTMQILFIVFGVIWLGMILFLMRTYKG